MTLRAARAKLKRHEFILEQIWKRLGDKNAKFAQRKLDEVSWEELNGLLWLGKSRADAIFGEEKKNGQET